MTQTLDERQADKGKLILEVKAVGVGLVPDLERAVRRSTPAGFEITKTEDQGVAVKKFEEDAEKNADRLGADVDADAQGPGWPGRAAEDVPVRDGEGADEGE